MIEVDPDVAKAIQKNLFNPQFLSNLVGAENMPTLCN